MASFAVLNEEKKILRRKEKEAERQKKLNAKIDEIKAAPVTKTLGKWADASDDEELMAKPAPVSDTESESEHEGDQAPVVEESWENHESTVNEIAKVEAAPAPKKKEAKKQAKPEEEDLDAILGELGIDIKTDEGGASGSKRNRKKKEKEAEGAEAAAGGYPKDGAAKDAKPKEEKPKAAKAKEENGAEKENEEEKVVDEAAKQAALEALKKKKAAALKKPAASDSAKLAAAEAKKRAEQKKGKKDKSMYDR